MWYICAGMTTLRLLNMASSPPSQALKSAILVNHKHTKYTSAASQVPWPPEYSQLASSCGLQVMAFSKFQFKTEALGEPFHERHPQTASTSHLPLFLGELKLGVLKSPISLTHQEV